MQSDKSTYENIKKEETTEKPTKHEIFIAKIKMYLLIFVVTGIVFVSADEFCDKQISYDTYIADGISNQPPSAITSTNGTTVAKYCYSDNKLPTQSGGPEDTTFVYWWVYLGVALFKSFDTYLKFDSIKDSCSHFTGSWKNGVSCIWDVGATMIAWAGAVKKFGNRIQQYHAYVHSNPFVEYPLAEISKRDDYYVNMMMEDVDEFSLNIGHVAHEVETLKFHTGTHTVSTKEESEKRDDLKYIEAIRLLTADKDRNKHHFIIGDNGGATYFQWSPRSNETYVKRNDGRFEDEKFNGAGMEANICRAEEDSDSGHTNLDGDYVTWRDDLKCHEDIMSHSGFYAQGYDKNNQGTMFSLSVAPYTSDKKGILDSMTKCPSGLGHACGRT